MTFLHDLSGPGIDVARESVLSFGEAARYVGRLKGTKAVAFQTLFRWSTKGCSGVVLETIYVGGTRCTSKEALQRFFAGVTVAREVRAGRVAAEAASPGAPVGLRWPATGNVDEVLRRSGIAFGEEAA